MCIKSKINSEPQFAYDVLPCLNAWWYIKGQGREKFQRKQNRSKVKVLSYRRMKDFLRKAPDCLVMQDMANGVFLHSHSDSESACPLRMLAWRERGGGRGEDGGRYTERIRKYWHRATIPASWVGNEQPISLSQLWRDVWKHDRAGGERDTCSPLLFLSITLHTLCFWINK